MSLPLARSMLSAHVLRSTLGSPWHTASLATLLTIAGRPWNIPLMPTRKPAVAREPEDAIQAAFRVVREATGQVPKTEPERPVQKNPEAAARGREGGLKGGKARAAKLTTEERSQQGKKAAQARWGRGA